MNGVERENNLFQLRLSKLNAFDSPLSRGREEHGGLLGFLADPARPFHLMPHKLFIPLSVRRRQLFAVRPPIEAYFHRVLQSICRGRIKVTAQKSIGPYVVDFVLRKGKRQIVIEIDGGYHAALAQHLIDIKKTDYFVSCHYSVWRLTPGAAQQMSREQIMVVLQRLFDHQNVEWMCDADVEHPLDPALQFRQFS